MHETVCKRYYVVGRVQGVWFRARTAEQGQRLGLRGWALNLPDGRVEVLACGPAEQIAELGEWLQRGPSLAKVTRVDVQAEEADQFDELLKQPGAVSFQ